MPYNPTNWQNGPGGGTPINAGRLNNLEGGISGIAAQQAADEAATLFSSKTVQAANYSAIAGDFVPVDATGGSRVVTLPLAPTDRARVGVSKWDSSANLVTVTVSGSDVMSGGATMTYLSTQGQSVVLQYSASQATWYAVSKGNPTLTVSVKDFGARGDGVADDTTAINACIAASAVGSTIFFPAGTYLVSAPIIMLPQRQYVGAGHAHSDTSVIKQKNSANITNGASLTGLLVANAWYTDAGFCDSPIRVQNLTIDGNKANNGSSTACGIVLTNYRSWVVDCDILNTPKDGVRLTDTTANGSSTVSNTCVENRIVNCHIDSTGLDGVRNVSGNGNSNTDGYLTDCIISNTAGSGINLDRSAGWHIRGNHLYTVAVHGINANKAFGTFITSNYVEDFGGQATAASYYAGIALTQLTGRQSTVSDNYVGCNETSASVGGYQYVSVSSAYGSTDSHVMVTGNMLHGPVSPTNKGIALVYASAGGGSTSVIHETNNDVTSVNSSLYNDGSALVKKHQSDFKIFNAIDYGVIADGNPHNNAANLLDCFAQAIAAGAQEVILPAGTINTSDAVIGTVTASSGRTYTNNGGIPLPTGNQGLTVSGHGKSVTTIKLSPGFPRAFDFWLVTSNQSYKNITLRNFTVDRNNMIGTTIAAPATVSSGVTLTPNTWVTLPGVAASGFTNAQYIFCPASNAGTAKKRMVPARVSGGSVQVFNTEASVALNTGDTVQGALYGHTILGTFCGVYIAGSNMYIDQVTVENVDAINLADTPGTNNSEESPDRCTGISITVLLNTGFTVTGVPCVTNFYAKNVRVLGGSRGIDVTGNKGTFLDEVWFVDCFHDTMISPTVNWDSLNFMIGQDAWVNRCGFLRCRGRNAGDVAWEIDQPWDAHVVDCIWEEGFNGGYTTTFQPPARTNAGPPTTTLSGSLTSGAISATVAAMPSVVSLDGLCLVDDELMWYSASSSTALTLNRGVNGTTAASHSSGATVTFVEIFKTRVHDVRSKIYSSVAMTMNGGGRAYLSYANHNLPLPPLTIRDATAEFSGGTLTQGQFLYWQGWRPDLDMQGVKVNHVGLTQPSGTAYGSLVSWLDAASANSMAFTNAIRPRIFGRNNSFRAHGSINSTSQYSAFHAGEGFAYLDFEMTVEAVMNGASPGAGVRFCNLWPLVAPFVLDSGSRVAIRARNPGFTGSDAAPIVLVVGPGPAFTSITNGLHVDIDMYDFSFTTNSTDTFYSPWYIGAGNVGKVQFGKIRHSRNAVGSYPVAKRVAVPVSANYTVAPDDEILLVDSSGGALTITLPPSTGGSASLGEPLARGRELQITDVGFAAATNNITIAPASTDKIDKGAAGVSVKLAASGGTMKFIPYASLPGWVTVGSTVNGPATFDATDQGYISWACDPAMSWNGLGPNAGFLYVSAVPVRRACTITNVITGVAVAGSGLTSGQNFACLYNVSGTLLSQTADQTTAWGSAGIKTMALSTPQTVAPGIYYVGVVSNGTTPPKLFMPIGGPYAGGLMNGTPVRFGYDATHTGLTTTAPSTMASPTSSVGFWAAIS